MWFGGKKRGLRQFVVAILQKGPRNGAEIINDMEAMTHGWWRPSPGSVYPLLEEMVTEEILRKRPDGRYESIAPASFPVNWFGPSPRTAQDALQEIGGLVAFLEDLKGSPGGALPAEGRAELSKLADRLRHLGE